MEGFLNILLVEDNPGDARIVKEYLKEEASVEYNLHHAESLSQGLKILSNKKIDIILSDLGLPDSQGIDTFYNLKKLSPGIPVILFTGLNDNELGLQAVKMGAEDYLVKGQVEQQHVIRSINYAIERKNAKNRQNVISRILSILNRPNEWNQIIKDILHEIKEFSGIEATAIRIYEEYDYPYMDTLGFSTDFTKTEKSLCIKDLKGNIVLNANGIPALECMCGNIISGRTDSEKPFFTKSGSFWTNSTTKLLALATEGEPHLFTRNRCHKDGYESVALVPVISGDKKIGLLQLNDKRTGCFTTELITFFEEIASTIGIAYKRVKIEKEIKEKEEHYRTIFETAANLITSVDNRGIIVDCNNQSLLFLGYTREELTGQSMAFIIHPDYMAKAEASLSEIFEKGFTYNREYKMVTKDGDIIDVNINSSVIKDVNHDPIRTICIINNITEQKKANELLRVERSRLRVLIDNLPGPIYVKDVDGRKLIANSADIKNICLSSQTEVLGKTDLELFPGEIGVRGYNDDMEILQTGNPIVNREEYFVDAKGQKRWFLTTKIPLFDEFEKTTGLVGIGHDITESKNFENELKSALEKAKESDRLKSAFLATMSHELRTPLNAIIGFSGFLEKDLPGNDIVEFGEIIKSSGEHLLSIVNDIFDVTLIESGETKLIKEKINLNTILYDTQNIMEVERQRFEKNHIEIKLIPPSGEEDLIINTDPLKLRQILVILLKNSLKFTNEGYIHYGYKIESDKNNPVLKFYVEDTGIGIPINKREVIFDSFRQADESLTRKYGGTGIGLSISKKLAELLGGKIWVESEEGKGSTFYFTIAINDLDEANKPVVKKSPDISSQKGKIILVVEDDEPSFRFLKTVLEKSGIKILWAKNGLESVDQCQKNTDIDLVLMDINMPVMNGIEATKKIKKIRPGLPIIAQTAYAIAGDHEMALEAGCDNYIAKPIKRDELMGLIEKHLIV